MNEVRTFNPNEEVVFLWDAKIFHGTVIKSSKKTTRIKISKTPLFWTTDEARIKNDRIVSVNDMVEVYGTDRGGCYFVYNGSSKKDPKDYPYYPHMKLDKAIEHYNAVTTKPLPNWVVKQLQGI